MASTSTKIVKSRVRLPGDIIFRLRLHHSLLLPWQSANVRSETANTVVSKLGRLRTSQIPNALSVSSAATPPCHHLPALSSEIGELRQNRYSFGQGKLDQRLYLGISPFCSPQSLPHRGHFLTFFARAFLIGARVTSEFSVSNKMHNQVDFECCGMVIFTTRES